MSDIGLRSALDAAAAAAGLQAGQPLDATAVASIAGPFVTRDVAGPTGAPVLCVAVRDDLGAGAEELCRALAEAAGGDRGAEGEPVATGAEVAARFTGPYEAMAIGDGDSIQALVLTAVERRGSNGGASVGPGGAATLGEAGAGAIAGFDKLVNVSLDVSVELGRTRLTLSEVLELDVGSVVELDRAAGAPVDIRVNGTLLAQGEVVLIDDEYAVRITAIVEPGALG